MLFIFIVSIVFLGESTAQLLRPGPCPKVKGVNYDLNRVVGVWYEYAASPDKYKGGLKCITNNWLPPKNGVSTFISTAVSKITENVLRIESECFINKTDNSINTLSHVPLIGETFDSFWDFEIIYDSHSISWSCQEIGSDHVQSSTIYTKEPYPKMDIIARAQQILVQKGLFEQKYQKYDNRCYFYKNILPLDM